MKSYADKTVLLAAVFAALAVVPMRAQVAELNAAYAEAAAAKPSAAPAKPASCDDATELETPFELEFTAADGQKLDQRFEYAGCEWTPRNDYQAAYTTRDYQAKDGYGLTLVTNEGEDSTEVLLSKGQTWIGNLGSPSNAALVSGDPLNVDIAPREAGNTASSRATLRDAAKPLYPQLKNCEAADWSKAAVAAPLRTEGKPAHGWNGRSGPSLVLLTKTAAFYYHEDCDTCAEITRCELSSGVLTSAVRGHSADCSDLKSFSKNVVFSACPDSSN